MNKIKVKVKVTQDHIDYCRNNDCALTPIDWAILDPFGLPAPFYSGILQEHFTVVIKDKLYQLPKSAIRAFKGNIKLIKPFNFILKEIKRPKMKMAHFGDKLSK